MINKIDAIILAGGKTKGELKEASLTEDKALLLIKNVPMVSYVVSALSSSRYVDKIIVVGEKEHFDFLEDKVSKIIPSSDSILKNALAGIKYSTTSKVLIAAADIPLIKGEMIDAFVEQCQKEEDYDFYYPIIEKRQNQEKYPTTKRTYAKLKEGVFTGGNIALVNPIFFTSNTDLLNEIVEKRKSVVRLVRILGIIFLFKLILGILTIKEAEKRTSEILGGMRVKAVEVNFPEIGIDVDKLSDLRLVQEVIENV